MATRVTDGARRERNEKRETTRKARENGLSRSSDFLASKLKCWQARHVKRDFRVCLNNRYFSAALVSRVSRLRRSRARVLLSLKLKKKRDCSQSKTCPVWKSWFLLPFGFICLGCFFLKNTVPFCLPFKFATSDIFGIFLSVPHSNRSHFGLIQSMGGGKYICHVFAEYKVSAWSHTIWCSF